MATAYPPDYEIVGISLVGPSPLGSFHFRWDEALTVLYGPNGAGKSVILRGIEAALTGGSTPGAAYLHVRLTDAANPIEWDAEYFTPDLIAKIAEWIRENLITPGGWLYEYDHQHDWSAHEEMMSSDNPYDTVRTAVTGQWSDEPDKGALLADAVERYRTFTLRALGDQGWEICPSVPLGVSNPVVESIREEAHAQWFVEDGTPFLQNERDTKLKRKIRPNPSIFDGIVLALADPPPWVPIPVAVAGNLETTWGPEVIALGTRSVDDVTQRYFLDGEALAAKELFAETDEDAGRLIGLADDLDDAMAKIAETANAVLSDVVPDFPTVRLKIHPAREWLKGRFLSWTATDRPSGTQVPLSALSEAQQRWAALAIQTALWARRRRSFYSAMLIDEPELALHSQAAHRVAAALNDLSRQNALPVIVTSHSPAFLDLPSARLIHVFRDPAGTSRTESWAEAVGEDLDGALERLGLRRSESLQLIRVFLVVEGPHDKIVLETLFGDRFAELRASILLMHGDRNALSILDSQFLSRYTDAAVLAVLDGNDDDTISKAWRRAKGYAKAGDVEKAARSFQRSTEHRRSNQDSIVKQLVTTSFESGKWHNFELVRLSRPDIVYYLNPADIDKRLPDWDTLQSEYLASRLPAEDGQPAEAVKMWLDRVKNVRVTQRSIRQAASNLDQIDPDLTRLLSVVESLARLTS